jgi:hypothetical protein
MFILLKVPDGKYCWRFDGKNQGGPCSYFDNAVTNECSIITFHANLTEDGIGVLKCKEYLKASITKKEDDREDDDS